MTGGAGASSVPPDGASDTVSDCGPPMELAPCRGDSDCHSAYLVCVPPDYVGVTVCRNPDVGATRNPACLSYPELATAPLCPTTVKVTSAICEVRYQRPCTMDADCGAIGFTCMSGRCERALASTPCNSASDCPAEWDCYVPCACPGIRDAKVCEPPFVEFNCPECPARF